MKKIVRLFLWAPVFFIALTARAQDQPMYAHFINVGQGASALLEFPCGVVMIDAGAQDDDYHKSLMDYLTRFFEKRKDLNNTIDLLMVTHPHVDHNEAVIDITKKFTVKRYIDDGLRVGSGKVNQKWMQDSSVNYNIIYKTYSFEDITGNGNKKGKTDTIIDPINCTNGNPEIILYSGRMVDKPGNWSNSDFTNYNNHSLVIKVLYGNASFLFTGDLEKKGIRTIIDEYEGTGALDADVLMVGHHGAANATTENYLDEVTPLYAVISCGEWDFGKGSSDPYTTFAYGHPRISTINILDDFVPGNRSQALQVKAADGAKDFRNINIKRRIYSTSWDSTIMIRATTAGKYIVYTEN